jgi:hypothetical protein
LNERNLEPSWNDRRPCHCSYGHFGVSIWLFVRDIDRLNNYKRKDPAIYRDISIIQVSRIGSMDFANAGSGMEMDAIAAAVVGGTSMSGGRGFIMGTVFGMLIISVMNNLLNLFGVPPFLREAFKGFIVKYSNISRMSYILLSI